MATKQGGKGGAASGKAKKAPKAGADDKREDVLQAVVSLSSPRAPLPTMRLLVPQVLADSFQDRFLPFTLERPRVRRTLPVANTHPS